MSQQLSIHDFANRKYEVEPGNVAGIVLDGERVWVKIEEDPGAGFSMIEVQNVKVAKKWGQAAQKLESF